MTDQARKLANAEAALEDAEMALATAIKAGASDDDLYELDAATITAALTVRDAGR